MCTPFLYGGTVSHAAMHGQEIGHKNFDWLFSVLFLCSVLVDHLKLLKLNISSLRKENHQELLRKQKEGRETRVHTILTLPPQGVLRVWLAFTMKLRLQQKWRVLAPFS